MRTLLLLLVVGLVAGCQTPLPPVDPHMAWVDFSTPSPGGKLLMAGRHLEETPVVQALVVETL
ncbi:MAG: hypothetical protein ABS999_06065, partial [Pseudomonas atacamensis]